MKKVLILGALGNLGGELIRVFAPGHEIIAWDKAEIDITDKDLVAKKVAEQKPAVVINAAAYNAVDLCESDEAAYETAKKINGVAPGQIAQACLVNGSVFVHFSSDYVFGGRMSEDDRTRVRGQGGFLEHDEPHPVNRYAETKLMGERAVIALSGKRLKWYLVRTSKLFGPRPKSAAAKPSFFDTMLKLGRERGQVEVVNSEVSCFTYTPDLARTVKEMVVSKAGYGIYHVVNPGPASWYKAAKDLYALAGLKTKVDPVPPSHFPRPARRPRYSVLKSSKWPPLRDRNEALREYLASSSS